MRVYSRVLGYEGKYRHTQYSTYRIIVITDVGVYLQVCYEMGWDLYIGLSSKFYFSSTSVTTFHTNQTETTLRERLTKLDVSVSIQYLCRVYYGIVALDIGERQ
jgi:hypothetical protein